MNKFSKGQVVIHTYNGEILTVLEEVNPTQYKLKSANNEIKICTIDNLVLKGSPEARDYLISVIDI